MSKNIIGIAIAGWVASGIFAAGAINADFRGSFSRLYQSPSQARSNLAMSLGTGLVAAPIAFVMSPFLTGFYQHGWTLSGTPLPCTETRFPEIWCKP